MVINAAGGPKFANGACVEIILNEVMAVVRFLHSCSSRMGAALDSPRKIRSAAPCPSGITRLFCMK